jgi:glycosyltransferase involved in cell wall biosynthesis
MRIAVNARLLRPHLSQTSGYFIKQVFFKLAEQYPQQQFIFFFDRPFSPALVFPQNVEPVVVNLKAQHALYLRWWFDVKISTALKKYKADVFVSPDGFCSLYTNIPQVLVVHDLAFLYHPNFIPKHLLWFYKRYMPLFIQKAKVVCTVSEFLKQEIIRQYKVAEKKIQNVGSAANPIFKPIDWQERENIKEEFAEGCEYFVFVAGIHPKGNLMNLLKAFSIFKKWQKTNMKLLVASRLTPQLDDIVEKLKTFKYRDEVKMLGYLPEDTLAKVVAAAYALVHPVFAESFAVPIVEAMQCEVPVITSDKSSMRGIAGEAALYADPSNPEEIAAQMKLIFKDEQLRSKLIAAGRLQVQNFSWEKTVQLMWQSIQHAISK